MSSAIPSIARASGVGPKCQGLVISLAPRPTTTAVTKGSLTFVTADQLLHATRYRGTVCASIHGDTTSPLPYRPTAEAEYNMRRNTLGPLGGIQNPGGKASGGVVETWKPSAVGSGGRCGYATQLCTCYGLPMGRLVVMRKSEDGVRTEDQRLIHRLHPPLEHIPAAPYRPDKILCCPGSCQEPARTIMYHLSERATLLRGKTEPFEQDVAVVDKRFPFDLDVLVYLVESDVARDADSGDAGEDVSHACRKFEGGRPFEKRSREVLADDPVDIAVQTKGGRLHGFKERQRRSLIAEDDPDDTAITRRVP